MIPGANDFKTSSNGRRQTFLWNVGGPIPDPDGISGTYRVRVVLTASHDTYSKEYQATLAVERLYPMSDGGEMVRTRVNLRDPEDADRVWLFREAAGRFSAKRMNDFAAAVYRGVRSGELGAGTKPGRVLLEAVPA